jgi:hypothetical protein
MKIKVNRFFNKKCICFGITIEKWAVELSFLFWYIDISIFNKEYK